ncbi:hypothetical protein PG997_013673 [Apiospora hydei]|uniref:Uncharacterized protein n=1 Tax=Apiospora hydei TaxID=1337664 RepID=A0ABR1V6V2_9PEZI
MLGHSVHAIYRLVGKQVLVTVITPAACHGSYLRASTPGFGSGDQAGSLSDPAYGSGTSYCGREPMPDARPDGAIKPTIVTFKGEDGNEDLGFVQYLANSYTNALNNTATGEASPPGPRAKRHQVPASPARSTGEAIISSHVWNSLTNHVTKVPAAVGPSHGSSYLCVQPVAARASTQWQCHRHFGSPHPRFRRTPRGRRALTLRRPESMTTSETTIPTYDLGVEVEMGMSSDILGVGIPSHVTSFTGSTHVSDGFGPAWSYLAVPRMVGIRIMVLDAHLVHAPYLAARTTDSLLDLTKFPRNSGMIFFETYIYAQANSLEALYADHGDPVQPYAILMLRIAELGATNNGAGSPRRLNTSPQVTPLIELLGSQVRYSTPAFSLNRFHPSLGEMPDIITVGLSTPSKPTRQRSTHHSDDDGDLHHASGTNHEDDALLRNLESPSHSGNAMAAPQRLPVTGGAPTRRMLKELIRTALSNIKGRYPHPTNSKARNAGTRHRRTQAKTAGPRPDRHIVDSSGVARSAPPTIDPLHEGSLEVSTED